MYLSVTQNTRQSPFINPLEAKKYYLQFPERLSALLTAVALFWLLFTQQSV